MSRALKEATSQSTLPREDPACAKRREGGGAWNQGDGFLGCSLAADRRLVEVMRILEVSRCGASCDWAEPRIMIQAPVYAVPHGVPYTRGFSVSGTALSVLASFFFPGEKIRRLPLTQCLAFQHTRPQALNTRCPEPSHPSRERRCLLRTGRSS